MKKNRNILEPLVEFSRLKEIPRTGWVKKIGIENPETVASHSLGVALAGMIVSDILKLDTEKILKMALLHDLAEVVIGDLTPEEKSWEKSKETKVMRELLSKLPNNTRNEYLDIWSEYVAQRTEESRLVASVDLLDMGIQALKYEKMGYESEKFNEFWDRIEENLKSEYVIEVFEILKRKRAELNGRRNVGKMQKSWGNQ